MHKAVRQLLLAIAILGPPVVAQARRVPAGNVPPKARPEFDQGPVDPVMPLNYMSLVLKRSAAQQAELDRLLEEQQKPGAPQYHRWLTPEQFGERFGARPEDIDRLTGWLQSAGFTVKRVARARDSIIFSGTAQQVQAAFYAEIHYYRVDGKLHYANASAPSVPEELAGLIAAVRGLNNFGVPPRTQQRVWPPVSIVGKRPRPDWYSQKYPKVNTLAPADLATIYNINPLYQSGIDGSGQTIAVVGQTGVDLADIQFFRATFGLPSNDPQPILVPGSDDPGITDDLGEADLDLEWAGAIAPKATLLYVYSTNAFESAFYVIDEALAPVLSVSYGACELRMSENDVATLASHGQKAAAEGITWLSASGDAGASDCEDQNGHFTSAITRATVDLPASLPWVTGVGGTAFDEGNGKYWAAGADQNMGTALGYIPERAWNDEAWIAQNHLHGFASGGGGASWYFSKPSWQTGRGVPDRDCRYVPDVSLTASWFHDPYALITGGNFEPNGGTSASAPTFAGMVALLNQYLMSIDAQSSPGLGNINPMLYALASVAPAAFHDITVGDNVIPCVMDSTQDCATGSFGYPAAPGYDMATGLGSVDAYALAQAWSAAVLSPHLVITKFTASTRAQVEGPFSMELAIDNQGGSDSGAFEMRVYFTINGDRSTANEFYVYCNADNLGPGDDITCSGTVTLGPTVTPGTYLLLAVADANNSVQQFDHSGGTALASTGALIVAP